jgi:hypothetical protein
MNRGTTTMGEPCKAATTSSIRGVPNRVAAAVSLNPEVRSSARTRSLIAESPLP